MSYKAEVVMKKSGFTIPKTMKPITMQKSTKIYASGVIGDILDYKL